MPLNAKTTGAIPANQKSAVNLTNLRSKIGGPTAEALGNVETILDQVIRALRTPQSVEELYVTDTSGKVIFWVDTRVVNGRLFRGFWSAEGYIGGDSAEDAPFYSNTDGVSIGKNGFVSIRNTRDEQKGFIGVQTEAAKSVVSVANNGSGLIRFEVTAHGYISGDTVDAFYPGVADDEGSWPITVIDANHFDLIGSTFSGALSGTASVYRYYGGIWSETAAFSGTGFADAKLRALANGDLLIRDAVITIDGIDPTSGDTYQVTISPSAVEIDDVSARRRVKLSGGYVLTEIYNISDVVTDQGIFNAVSVQLGHSGVAWGVAYANAFGNDGYVMTFLGSVGSITLNGTNGNASFSGLVDIGSASVDGATGFAVFNKVTVGSALINGATGEGTFSNIYTKAEVDALLAAKSVIGHTHTTDSQNVASVPSSHSHSVNPSTS
jgi:hypothetical protein